MLLPFSVLLFGGVMKRLLLAFLLVLSFAVAAVAAPIHIRDFQALVDVGNDGSIVVQKQFLVQQKL